jgi:hypothetical protein
MAYYRDRARWVGPQSAVSRLPDVSRRSADDVEDLPVGDLFQVAAIDVERDGVIFANVEPAFADGVDSADAFHGVDAGAANSSGVGLEHNRELWRATKCLDGASNYIQFASFDVNLQKQAAGQVDVERVDGADRYVAFGGGLKESGMERVRVIGLAQNAVAVEIADRRAVAL